MARYSNNTVLIQDANGKPITNAYTYFYEPGTTTLKSIYSDSDLTITQANPVRSIAGYLPEIYIDGLYKVVQNDENDVTLWPSLDPVGEIIAGQFEDYNSAETYVINEIVLATDGDFYISLVSANQGNEPSVSVSQWQLIPVKDMVGLTETQTLTNKTLTAPILTSPDIDQVVDSAGNEVVIFGKVASAVNELTVTNAATGNNPSIAVSGEDVGVDIEAVTLKNGLITSASVGVAAFSSAVGYRELISTATASASATVEFTSGISSTYSVYEVELINVIPATDGTFLNATLSVDGGTTWETDYTSEASAAATALVVAVGNVENTAAQGGICGNFSIYNPSSTSVHTHAETKTAHVSSTSGFLVTTSQSGKYDATTAVDGVQFIMGAGNIASGEFKLYGVK